jgi:hypothetical protein
MAARPTARLAIYRYCVSSAGMKGQLSATVERAPNDWWHWSVFKEGGAPFKQGQNICWDDAISAATICLNQRLAELGVSAVIDNPKNWIGEDRPKSLKQSMRDPRSFKRSERESLKSKLR